MGRVHLYAKWYSINYDTWCRVNRAFWKIVKRVEGNLGTQIFDRGSVPLKVTSEELTFYKIAHPDTSRELRAYYNNDECTELQKIFVEYLKNSPMPG